VTIWRGLSCIRGWVGSLTRLFGDTRLAQFNPPPNPFYNSLLYAPSALPGFGKWLAVLGFWEARFRTPLSVRVLLQFLRVELRNPMIFLLRIVAIMAGAFSC